ncbi:hypothetical protein GCM10009557_12220 [Virgisporangium ochraceum]|uniref:Uncharacterized protein n=1 Tax=Virgisporangium ochraceum TaxID=65505 RepID=A0A8J4A754_9ACTN|nr:hypothetical protein [Virgisporangium ochraceum]GIJ75413.1 hypothetical protein Voc01_103300 [Virgisporangium ochraceum]
MTYELWNQALADRFFRKDLAGVPVYLSVDDEVLTRIAEESGWPSKAPDGGFAEAVRSEVFGARPFDRMLLRAYRWRRSGSSEVPPCVAVLGATVLAASRMGPGDRRGPGAYSYYRPLREILGLAGEGMPAGYDEAVPRMWSYLNDWLDKAQDGGRGVSTARTRPSVENIGWSLSQTLIRGADRARLAAFFQAIGAQPGEALAGSELLLRLREWCRTAGRGSKLSRVAFDTRSEQLIADVLETELRRFDGVSRDDSGRLCLPVHLVAADRSWAPFSVAVFAPGAMPPIATADGPAVPQPTVRPGSWNLLTDVDVSLGGVVDTVVDGVRLLLGSKSCYVFQVNDFLGAWASVEAAEVGVEHRVVVRVTMAGAAEAAMAACGASDVRVARRAGLPPGWVGFAGFVPRHPAAVPSAVSALSPRAGQLASLAGGLRVSSRERVYLADFPPDLVVPDADAVTMPVEVDGMPQKVDPAPSLTLPLSGLALAPGPHTIRVGSRTLSLSLVQRLRETTAPATIGLPVDTTSRGDWIGSVPRQVNGADGADRWVSGAVLHGVAPRYRRTLLARAAEIYVLGPDHGQAARIHPGSPSWLKEIGLPEQEVELEPALVDVEFDAEWVVAVTSTHRRVHRVSGAAFAPGPAPLHPAQPVERAAWYRLVGAQGRPFRFPGGNEDAERWARFLEGGG